MSAAKHTLGRWVFDADDYVIRDSNGDCIIYGGRLGDLQFLNPDDIPLVAAAPDLLEALERARFFVLGEALPTKKQCLADIDAIIAKATGSAS